jgi:hypothetical protein
MLLFLAFTKIGMIMILITLLISKIAAIPQKTWIGGSLLLGVTSFLSFKILKLSR